MTFPPARRSPRQAFRRFYATHDHLGGGADRPGQRRRLAAQRPRRLRDDRGGGTPQGRHPVLLGAFPDAVLSQPADQGLRQVFRHAGRAGAGADFQDRGRAPRGARVSVRRKERPPLPQLLPGRGQERQAPGHLSQDAHSGDPALEPARRNRKLREVLFLARQRVSGVRSLRHEDRHPDLLRPQISGRFAPARR